MSAITSITSAVTSSSATGSVATAQLSQPLLRTAEAAAAAVTPVPNTTVSLNADPTTSDPQRDFVRVSSSIGKAASAGQLSRQEALDIYRQIASLL